MTERLFIGTPAYSGEVSLGFLSSLLPTIELLRGEGMSWSFRAVAHMPLIGHARAQLVAQFLHSDADRFLMVDADCSWEAAAVPRLVGLDLDFIAGVAPAGLGEHFDIPAHYFGRPEPNGLLRAERVGGAFCLFKRAVFERMHAAYPELHVPGPDPHLYALFNPTLAADGWHGEDIALCDRWRALGGEIWIDPRLVLSNARRVFTRGCLADALAAAGQRSGPKERLY
jgi:hypothetical protein